MKYKSPFLNEVQRVLRVRGYAYQTEKTYIYWIRYYIKFHQDQHRNVAVNTQNQPFGVAVRAGIFATQKAGCTCR